MKHGKEKVDLIKKILQEIDQSLMLSSQELLKLSELSDLEDGIRSLLNEIKDTFQDLQKRKIEKITSGTHWKSDPRPGSYASSRDAIQKLVPLKVLLEELLEFETGVRPINIPLIDADSNESLKESIRDAQLLFNTHGAPNAIDRFHTLMHAYLKGECLKINIPFDKDATLNTLLRLLREKHPILIELQKNEPEAMEIIKGMGNTLSNLSEIRNNKSLAHPESLISEDEALFVINSVNTMLKYLTSKLS